MSEVVKVRLLLAKFPDDTEPVVIGCVDQTIWDHWEIEDEDRWRKAGIDAFGADPTDLELREIWASFAPSDLVNAFRVPTVLGIVDLENSGV